MNYRQLTSKQVTYLRLAPNAIDAALIKYDAERIREAAAKNRRLSDNKHPTLKRPECLDGIDPSLKRPQVCSRVRRLKLKDHAAEAGGLL